MRGAPRILGVFFMRDEAGLDAKLLTVLEHDPQWDNAFDIGICRSTS